MHHHIFERELAHLERVMASAPQAPFSASYWRERFETLRNRSYPPLFHSRIEKLSRLVAELGECVERAA